MPVMTQPAPPQPPPTRQSGAEELRAVAAGDQAAFTRLYRAHRERVFRVAYGILLDHAEAADTVQETFLRLHQVAGNWRPDALVSTWLYRVCVNLALSTRRRLAAFSREFIRSVSAPSPETNAAMGQALTAVDAAMGRLSAPQRAAVTLFLDAELTPSEIAPLLGLTANATRVTLHRGLEKLRTALRAHGIDAAPHALEQTLLEEE